MKTVVVATTKVGIFKQITTASLRSPRNGALLLLPQRQEFSSKSQLTLFQRNSLLRLLLLPQRQEFSSKSQLTLCKEQRKSSCCCYHKGRNFQANHNLAHKAIEVSISCCCYHKGRNFQANHNLLQAYPFGSAVVVATTKVGIFKQITTRQFYN